MISQGPSMCVFNKVDPQEVLASWIFVQYMLSNDVQIAYSNTEGYVPVTKKAQQSAEYQDYLARRGEDNDLHYAVKLDATRLLMEHVGDTFTTPVFNGSASLRDAAGQLIEETAKGVRRKKTVDDAFIDDLFKKMVNLYRLDQINVQGAEEGGETQREDLGPLPDTAVALLAGLVIVWLGIIAYVTGDWLRQRRRAQRG